MSKGKEEGSQTGQSMWPGHEVSTEHQWGQMGLKKW